MIIGKLLWLIQQVQGDHWEIAMVDMAADLMVLVVVVADEEDNITNLSLRLVASTVTSFLVLALLLFMVHRLRQRRLMLAMRRE